jgi:cellulose synthase operon protein YhjQ
MIKIALLNLKGGCGTTTIAANLADVLALDANTWLWQTDENDQLSLHFSELEAINHDWKQAIQMSDFTLELDRYCHSGSPLTLFASPRSREKRIGDFENYQKVIKMLTLLKQYDNETNLGYTVIQLPSQFYQSVDLTALTELVDLIFVVAVADAQTYQRLHHLPQDSFIHQKNVKLLINKFNPELTIENDIFTVLTDEYRSNIVPHPIHHSPELLESAANMTTIRQYAPHSLVYENIEYLATWSRQWIKANRQYE